MSPQKVPLFYPIIGTRKSVLNSKTITGTGLSAPTSVLDRSSQMCNFNLPPEL